MTDNVPVWDPPDPDDSLLEAFWTRAKNVAKINPLEPVMGSDAVSALQPAAYCFGDTKESADLLCNLILDGTKTATSSWGASYEHDGAPLPEVGELAIICNGSGIPRALLRTTRVALTALSSATQEISDAEGEGTFDEWKTSHEKFFRAECEASGIAFDPNGQFVTEFFEVLYKH